MCLYLMELCGKIRADHGSHCHPAVEDLSKTTKKMQAGRSGGICSETWCCQSWQISRCQSMIARLPAAYAKSWRLTVQDCCHPHCCHGLGHIIVIWCRPTSLDLRMAARWKPFGKAHTGRWRFSLVQPCMAWQSMPVIGDSLVNTRWWRAHISTRCRLSFTQCHIRQQLGGSAEFQIT